MYTSTHNPFHMDYIIGTAASCHSGTRHTGTLEQDATAMHWVCTGLSLRCIITLREFQLSYDSHVDQSHTDLPNQHLFRLANSDTVGRY